MFSFVSITTCPPSAKNQSSVSKQYILIISLTTYNQIIIIMIHLMNNKLVIFLISWM